MYPCILGKVIIMMLRAKMTPTHEQITVPKARLSPRVRPSHLRALGPPASASSEAGPAAGAARAASAFKEHSKAVIDK